MDTTDCGSRVFGGDCSSDAIFSRIVKADKPEIKLLPLSFFMIMIVKRK
jgi:hypothetical protein